MTTTTTPAQPPALVRHRFTSEDYARMLEVGILREDDRVELIGGEIVEMSPVGPRHAACVTRVIRLIVTMFGARATVRAHDPITLPGDSEPQPDLAIVRPSDDDYASAHPGPTDILWVIEIAQSSLDYDRRIKVPLYARAGIREVWIVDLETDTIEVHRDPGADGYADRRTYGRGESITAAAFVDDDGPNTDADVAIAVDDVLPPR